MLSKIFSSVTKSLMICTTGALKGVASPIVAYSSPIVRGVNLPIRGDYHNTPTYDRATDNNEENFKRRFKDYSGLAITSIAGAFALNSGLDINPYKAYVAISASLGIAYNIERSLSKRELK